ncbi:hypothetical protein H072_3842 [Dactylellina haptotyla CBS 200.50]|uniref:SET domain-containing protein n=1 Tax=Dactylellina haptotyla (strain CBS 200.50) TaxID=1284197 RepID=S8ALX6_DACHA|nr:hypothetical protein H072_3842 [Dactylellina haptotyla CBS 200.50]
MSQASDTSSSRKRGRPPRNRGTGKRRKDAFDAELPENAKLVTHISQNIVSTKFPPAPSRRTSSQASSQRPGSQRSVTRSGQIQHKTADNVYRDSICLSCWMPLCVNHSVAVPETRQTAVASSQPDESTKWILKREDVSLSGIAEKRPSFEPCSHEGPCDPSNQECSCNDQSVHCEKSCGCSSNCPRRWKGCQCKSGKSCAGERCPCINNNRECDPDLCLGCGADEQLDPMNRRNLAKNPDLDSIFNESGPVLTREEVRLNGCQNVFLQMDEPPMTKIGPTTMPFKGYGLFAMEPINKGCFIGEYKGEVISDEEADKRGSEYDRVGSSFLFSINETHAIDGTRFGNKTRFLNHSQIEPNCEAKVLFVNGAHRIAFRALEDIEIGEELLFNYGDKFVFNAVEREGALERKTTKAGLLRLKERRRETSPEEGIEDEDDDEAEANKLQMVEHESEAEETEEEEDSNESLAIAETPPIDIPAPRKRQTARKTPQLTRPKINSTQTPAQDIGGGVTGGVNKKGKTRAVFSSDEEQGSASDGAAAQILREDILSSSF